MSERRHFRPGRRTGATACHPVRDAYLERGVGVDAQQADARHPLTQVRRQAIHHERQHVGAERVTDEQHALLVPGREVVAQQARHVARGRFRRAPAPEILQRVQSHGRHATRCQARGEFLIESGPAAIPGEQQREFIRHAAGVHFGHRQVVDVRRPLRRRFRARREARIGVAKLRHPGALEREAMTDEWEFHHLCVRHLRCELIDRVRAAHLVLLPLQRDPRLLEARRGLEHQLVLLVARVVKPGARTQRRCGEILSGAEAETERAGEGPGRRLHQGRVYHGRAGGVADQHRNVILAHADFFLHLVAQGFEIRRHHLAGCAGALRRSLQAAEVLADIGTDHHRSHVGERARHADHAQLPATIAGEENRNAARLAVRNVDGDGAETPGRQARGVGGGGGGGGRGARGSAGKQCEREDAGRQRARSARPRGDRQRRDHLANNSFMPPAISTETSTSTLGNVMPPRATR